MIFVVCCGIGAAFAADASIEQLVKGAHYKRAHFALDAAIKKNPNDAQALMLMAVVKRAYSDLETAQKLLEKAVALDPKNPDYHYQLARTDGDLARKASVFRQLGLAHTVRKELDAALAIDPKHLESHYVLMIFYLEAPGIAGGDRKKAEDEAATIAKLDPAQGFLAQVEFAQKDKKPEQLFDLYLKAHQADPTNMTAAGNLANQYFNKKQLDMVEKAGREMIKVYPDRVAGYSFVSLALAAQKRWTDLDALLADAEKNVFDDLAPYFLAGRTIINDNGDMARAERYIRKYLTQEPEPTEVKTSRAHWRLAQILEKQGHKLEAIAELEQALKLESDFAPALQDLKRLK